MYNYMEISENVPARLRKWGNSFGVVVPLEVLKRMKIMEGEEVLLEIKKKNAMRELFGSLKKWKINSQKAKEELRREWNK